MTNVTFISSNRGKIEEVRGLLSMSIDYVNMELDEIQSLNLHDIIFYKARDAYKKLQGPVLVEDTSIVFEALKGLPGPFIKWFYSSLGREGLCKLLDQFHTREAQAISMFGYYDGITLKTFEGKIYGQIAIHPEMNKGFGWDAIFIPDGGKKTLAEMDKEEQEKFSIRNRALKKLEEYLTEDK